MEGLREQVALLKDEREDLRCRLDTEAEERRRVSALLTDQRALASGSATAELHRGRDLHNLIIGNCARYLALSGSPLTGPASARITAASPAAQSLAAAPACRARVRD